MALLGTKKLPTLQRVNYETYKLAFKDMAIWLQNSLTAFKFNANVSIPLPLVGFTYEVPSQLELLRYSYSQSPYLNKMQVSTSYIKETTTIVVRAKKVITNINTIPVNITTNMALVKALELYCDNGGLFTMLTPYGILTNMALVNLRTFEPTTQNEAYGINFEFEFMKINVSRRSGNILSKAISKLSGGFL